MKVTVVCDVLGVANNGTTIATLNLVRYLKKQGHKVLVVANDFGDEELADEEKKQLRTLSLGRLADTVIRNNGVSLAVPDKKLLRDAMEDADVVHIQLPLVIGVTAAKIAHDMGKPLTASFHCQAENVSAHLHLMGSKFVSRTIYKIFYKTLYKYCNCIHYPTEFIRDVFEKACHHKTNDYVISNGVNVAYVDQHKERTKDFFDIVCTGRFSAEKAQHLLIEAAAKSRNKDKIRLFFAGEGPLKSKYEKLAREYNVAADFSFYTRKELVDLLNRANLYVHTAFIEIEAISCIEAICCGLVPVIANAERSATRAFAIDDYNLFKENDSSDLAKKIDYWFEHPQLLAEYSERYDSMKKRFNQENCMKRMEEMLSDAVKMTAEKK